MAILVVTFFSFLLFSSLTVLADSNVILKAEAGINGEYKASGWVPVNVQITNNSNKDINGIITVENNLVDSNDIYYQQVTIAKNTKKEITLIVPAQKLAQKSNVILTENENELAKTDITGRGYANDTFFIGILANDSSTGIFFNSIPKEILNMSVKTVDLNEKDIDSTTSLENFDMIIINNYSLDSMNETQINSIKNWTQNGRLLVLSGGANYSKLPQSLLSISPVEYKGITQVDKLMSIEKAVQKPVLFQTPLTLSDAEVKNGQILFQENDTPVFVLGESTAGKILYVAYDLAEEPLAGWSGNIELWGSIFKQINDIKFDESKLQVESNDFWSLRNASEIIPSLKLPSFSTLLIFFSIYIFLVGPFLYFFLKRKKKQEWNWLIIPVLSVLIAFGIYQFSFFSYGNKVLTHHVSFLELADNNKGDLYTVSAFFVTKGGDYEIKFNDVDKITSADNYYQNQRKETWISVNPDQSNVILKDASFRSLRKVYSEKSVTAGNIESNIYYQNGKLTGKITNNTNLNLTNAKLIVGGNFQNIGDFPAGKDVRIDLIYNTANYIGYVNITTNLIVPNQNQNPYQTREAQMANILSQRRTVYKSYESYLPVLIGWTEEEIVKAELEDDYKDYHLTLVKATLDIQPTKDGFLFIPPGVIKPNLSVSSGKIEYTEEGYVLPKDSSINVEFNIDRTNIDIEKINIFTSFDNGIVMHQEIYNWETGVYEPFTGVLKNNYLEGEKINTYLSEDGKLNLQFYHGSDRYVHLNHPVISVEGRVVK